MVLVGLPGPKEVSMRGRRTDRRTAAAVRVPEPPRPENQHLLAFLDELAATPDEKGPTWWEEFRAFLRAAPIRLGPPPAE